MSHQRRTNSPTTPSHLTSPTHRHLPIKVGGGTNFFFFLLLLNKSLFDYTFFFFLNKIKERKDKMPRLITIHHHHQTVKDVFLHRLVRPHSSVSKRRFPFFSFFFLCSSLSHSPHCRLLLRTCAVSAAVTAING